MDNYLDGITFFFMSLGYLLIGGASVIGIDFLIFGLTGKSVLVALDNWLLGRTK